MAAASIYEFGPYHLEVSTRRLLRGEVLVPLTPKAFDTLVALIERHDRVVDKSELMQVVWPDSFVEEANLSQTVFVLRKALGEDSDGRQFIDTIPRRGYRFAAEVRTPGSAAAALAEQLPAGRPSRAALAWIAVAFVLIAAVVGWTRWRTSPGDPTIQSIAVLPLSNVSGQAADDYFAGGLTEVLTSDLAQVNALRVVASNSTARYRNTTKASAEVGRELGVDGLLQGAVLRDGERVRISMRLIHAASDRHVWARTYERRLADVLDLQREIARTVADEVRAVITPAERTRLARATTVNPQAHDAYLRGRFEFNKRTRDGFIAALTHFQTAAAIAPQFAEAYAGIADCHTGLTGFIHVRPDEAMPAGKAAAEKALAINPDLADAHASLGYIQFRYDYDWPRAEASLKRAIALNPSLLSARQWYAISLAWAGRLPEARLEMDRALLLDPLSLPTLTFSAWLHYFDRDYDQAVAVFDRALAIDPNYVVAFRRRGWALQMQQRHDEAIASFERARALSSGDLIETAALGRGYAMAGRRAEMLETIKELQNRDVTGEMTAYSIGEIYAAAGDAPMALAFLEKAADARSIWLVFLKAEPVFDRIRSEPRFQQLVDRIRW